MADEDGLAWLKLLEPGNDLPVWMDAAAASNFVLFLLRQGDPRPLATFLRRGFPFDEDMRHEIANMIDGPSDVQIQIKKTPGRGTAAGKEATEMRDFAVADYIRERMEREDIKLESVIAAAVAKFELKRGVVMAAWARWKNETSGGA